MINEAKFFEGFAFPWMLTDDNGAMLADGRGSLFPVRDDAISAEAYTYYPKARLGWSECPDGYAVYRTRMPTSTNVFLIVYRLKVHGLSSAKGKSIGLTIKVETSDIIEYVEAYLKSLVASNDQLQSIMRSSIHEVRSVNTDIYHATIKLKDDLSKDAHFLTEHLTIVRNIEALTSFLRDRTDVLDILSNPTASLKRGALTSVYKAFHKIVRSMTASANERKLKLKICGQSSGIIDGIELFTVIPYLLLQNAIKYSPNEDLISVDIQEDPDHIYVKVSSTGPLLEKDELPKIFSSGYRGENGKKVAPTGSGLGLFFLKQAVETHEDGRIIVHQDPSNRIIHSTPYCPTHFNLRFARDR